MSLPTPDEVLGSETRLPPPSEILKDESAAPQSGADPTIQKLFKQYNGLNSFSKPEDYLVQDANGKMKDILNKNNFKLEFQNKGETEYKVGNDLLQLDNPDKHRIYVNPDKVNKDEREDAIKLDVLSHAFHNNPDYNNLTNDLEKKLVDKYGEKMVRDNGGADAYVRGYLSNSKEYAPYKKELSFLPKDYFNKLDKIFSGDSDIPTVTEKAGKPVSDFSKQKTVEQFKSNPIFHNPRTREVYYKAFEDKGYDTADIRAIGDEIYPKKESTLGTAVENATGIADAFEGMKNIPITGLGGLSDAADIAASPINAFSQGIKHGVEKFKESAKVGVFTPAGGLKLANAILSTGFGAANVLPPVAAFTAGVNAAEKIVPEKAVEHIMQPVSNVLRDLGVDVTSEVGKEVVELGDVAASLLLFHKAHSLAKKVGSGKPMTTDEVQQAADIVQKSTPDQVQEAAKETIAKQEHPDLPSAAALRKQQLDLIQDQQKNPEAAHMFDEDIQNLQKQIEEKRQTADEKHIEKATEQAVTQSLVDEKAHLEKILATTSETGQAVVKKNLDRVNGLLEPRAEEIPNLPKMDEVVEAPEQPQENILEPAPEPVAAEAPPVEPPPTDQESLYAKEMQDLLGEKPAAEEPKAESPPDEKTPNLATDESGRQESTDTESGAGDTPAKTKIRRRGTPKRARKIRDERYKAALKIEHDNNPYDAALQHFIAGGEINKSAIQELFGNKNGKSVEGERRAKFGIIGKDAPSIQGLAHSLWENRPEGDDRYDTQDYRNAIEEVLTSHSGRKSMVDDILNRHNDKAKDMEDHYAAEYGDLADEAQQAESALENLSEEQLQKLAADQDAIEKFLDSQEPKPPTEELSGRESLKQKVADVGEQLKSASKKLGLSADDPNLHKSGITFDDVVDLAVKLINKGIDAHGDITKAINDALEKLRGTQMYKDLVGDKDAFEKKVRETFEPKEKKETGIRHKDTAALREGAGLEEYERNPETQAGWEAEAEKQIKEGYNIEELLTRTENGTQPTPVEQKILKKYIASVADKINTDASDANLQELKRLTDASDRIAGSAVAKSLVARQGTEDIDNTLAGYFMHEMAANNDAPLTEGQKATVVKEFNEIKEAKEALEKKMADLGNENNRLKAEKEIKKARANRPSIKKSHEDYVAERKSIIQQLKDEMAGKGKAQQSGLPITDKMVVLVAKLAKSYVEEGVSKLDDIISSIHSDSGLDKKDVQDILAGVHNAKKQTRNQASATLVDLKQQAKLINKLEALQNGVEPKTEKAKIQRSQEVEKLRKQIKDFEQSKRDAAKEESRDKRTPEQKALDTIKKRTQTLISKVEDQLRTGDLEKPQAKAQPKLDAEALRLKDKYIKVKQEREIRLLKQQYENRSKYEKTRDKLVDIANVPRTIMSSMDFSAPLRQAVVATVAHPVTAGKAAVEMFKQSISQERFDRWFHDVKEDSLYPRSQEAGLYIADPHDPRLSVKEEAFMNNLAEKIPIVGKAIKGSERAYVGYLNKMRWDLFHQFADQFEAEGKTFQNSPELYKGLASFVNNSTGRGKIGALESAAPILNSAFFAPRLIASRLNFLNPVYYGKLPKEVRAQALKDVGKFIGAGLTVMALAKLNGAQVESDPRSTDFGKIKSGNTRWDVWGGYQQYIRVLTQLFSGQAKSTATGKINQLNGEGVFGRTRGDVALSFVRGKLAPIPSVAADILSGRTTSGEKTTAGGEAQSHLLPLLYNDVYEAMQDQGMKALFTAGAPSVFGVGVQTYGEKKKSSDAEIKEQLEKRVHSKHLTPDERHEQKLESREQKTKRLLHEREMKEFAKKNNLQYLPPR